MAHLLGAILGDVIGSTREGGKPSDEDFELVPQGATYTDDSVLTLAVAEWLMNDPGHTPGRLMECLQAFGRRYPHAGYGGRFFQWLFADDPKPYNSFGNGSGMRVSPVGLYASSLHETLHLARISAAVTHDHPEGIKGAQAIAACVYLQRTGHSRQHIRQYVEQTFGYDLSPRLEDLRPDYRFDVTCQGSVPVAIMAFLQRSTAESALRLAVSMGGDADTIGCMTCAIATARADFGGGSADCLPVETEARCRALLPPYLQSVTNRFAHFLLTRHAAP